MPDNEIRLKITIDGKEAAAEIKFTDDEVKKLANTIKEANKANKDGSEQVVSAFTNARNLVQGFKEAFSVISGVFNTQITAYHEQEAALVKMNTALQQTGQLSEENVKRLTDYASQLQATTVYGDELTETVMAQLIAMGLTVDQAKEATLQAANLATVMGTDLNTAARAMADLFNGNAGMIGRYVKGLDETIIKSGDLNAIMQMLNERIGGQAVAIGQSSVGAIAKMNNAIGDLKENAGEMISKAFAPFIRMVSDLLNKLNQLSPTLSGIIGIATALTTAFVTLRVTGILPAIGSINTMGTALTGLQAAIVKTGLGALLVGLSYGFYELVKAYQRWKDISAGSEESFKETVRQLKAGAEGMDKTTLNKFISTAKNERDKLKQEYDEFNKKYDDALDKRINRDKEGNEYILKYETEKSEELKTQVEQKKHLLKLKEEEIKAYEEELNKKGISKTTSTVKGGNEEFTRQRELLEETQRHDEEMLRVETDSDYRLLLQKIKHFDELIALYKRYGKETIKLENQRVEAEAKLLKYVTFDELIALYKRYGKDTTKLENQRLEAEAKLQKDVTGVKAKEFEKTSSLKTKYDMEYFSGAEELEKQHQEYEIGLSKITNEEKLALLEENKENIAQGLGAAANMFAEHTVAYQAFAKAQALIDTYTSAQMAYKSLVGIPFVGPALGTAAAIAAIIAGIQRVEMIGKVQVPRTRGYALGGRFVKGESGFVEGYENEIVAPEKTFVEIFKQELRPQIFSGEGGRVEMLMEKYLNRIESWANNIQLEAAIRHTDIHLSNERGKVIVSGSML